MFALLRTRRYPEGGASAAASTTRCSRAVAARGAAFSVLADHFVVVVPHVKSASRRATLGASAHPLSKLRAEKLLDAFKQKSCTRSGLIAPPRG